MFRTTAFLLAGLLMLSPVVSQVAVAAPADASCEAKAIDKNGKPLAGAAKTSFMKKCAADAQAAP